MDLNQDMVALPAEAPPWDGINVPDLGERLMRMSSSLVAPSAIAIAATAVMLFSLSGAAMALTEPSGSTSLPSITVQAPKPRVARPEKPPKQRAVVRDTVRTAVSPGPSPSPAPAKPPPAQESVLAKLQRLERTSSSNLGGVATSFPTGNLPYVGCSASGWPAYSPAGTCRNGRNYKTYVECTEASHFLAWRPMEYHWYCTSLAFKK